jgi:hypothetical protein
MTSRRAGPQNCAGAGRQTKVSGAKQSNAWLELVSVGSTRIEARIRKWLAALDDFRNWLFREAA